MCVFCAAVPMAASVGALAHAKQREQIRNAEAQGKPAPRMVLPAGRVTLGVVGALMIGSLIYHTQLKIPY